jgi:hypothetical protein
MKPGKAQPQLTKKTPQRPAKAVQWWNGSLASALIAAVIGGLIVAGFQILLSHTAKDLTVQVTDEITAQLNQRSATDAGNLHNQITTEVAKGLEPIHTQLESLNQDIGKIKDHLHIARNELPPTDLKSFGPLNSHQFADSLPMLNAELKAAAFRQSLPDPDTLKTLAEKLSHTPETAPDYWPTTLQFITLVSGNVKGAPGPGKPGLVLAGNQEGGIRISPAIVGQIVLLDGGFVGPVRFEHCRIIFTDHEVKMREVSFWNCVFEMPTTSAPSDFLKRSVRALLASNLTEIKST